ncbi:SRPBCC family protein [Nocardioides sp. GY 10113]|uniref:SRPBCC family protein n=1 Tax=Nocardioides sp. GY 10113 TaxID=2569761 RepID=UPI0010A82D22|nr:SRPBCC family protein [Nocardioides sp. GY 10113]TIC83551.1 SRPBCC family protein [Nocardioides sp. GY 10113]
MPRITVDLPARVDRVAAYLRDPGNRPAWQSSLRAVADLEPGADGPGGVGTTWVDVTAVPGVRPRMRIVASTPDRWVEEGVFGPFRATLALTFSPLAAGQGPPGGTRVTADFEVSGAGLGPLLGALARRAIRADLRRAGTALTVDE